MTTDATAPSGAVLGSARQTDSHVITVANQKGGVGKTMLTLSLAAHIVAGYGRALVVDVDPQATAYDLTRLMSDPGYEVLHELDPAQLTHIRRLRDYDTILVDCPGSLEGNDVLAEVLARTTYAVIPYDHEPETVLPTLRTAERVRTAGVPFSVVLTKADPVLGANFEPWVKDAWATLESASIPHFRSVVRRYRAWPNSLKAGVPITRWNERHAPKLREDISGFYTELSIELGRRGLAGGTT
jgi:chromosome partitioning protein